MKIIASIIDESDNKEILAEWYSLESDDSIMTNWEPCELEISEGVKISVNASLTNDSNNLSIYVDEDGSELFAGHFSLNPVAMMKVKSKTGNWLEFVVYLD
jgi:6-phosphogluconolactonase (cycloisomerase 2 family)